MKVDFRKYKFPWLYLFPIFFVSLIFYKQVFFLGQNTFNFADNRGYFTQIISVQQLLAGVDANISLLTTPLITWPLVFLGKVFSEVKLFTLYYLLHFVIGWIGAYLLFNKVTNNKTGSIIGATFFMFSSLSIYANRFNLVGIHWLPFLLYYVLDNKKSFFKIFLFTSLFLLSGHYYFMLLFLVMIVYVFRSIFSHGIKKTALKTIPVILGTVISGILIAVPTYLTGGFNSVGTYSTVNKVQDISIDAVELFMPNNQNPITDSYASLFTSIEGFSSLRPSHYIGIIGTLLLLFGCISLFRNNYSFKKESTFFILLFFASFLLFLGSKLSIGGYVLSTIMPFDIFSALGLNGVFRKSLYFFYLIAFAGGGIIAYTLHGRHIILGFIISLGLVMENNFSFDRAVHTIDKKKLTMIEKGAKILPLPNSGFSINKYRYSLANQGFSVMKYPDNSIPFGDKQYDVFYEHCFLNELVMRGRNVIENCSIEKANERLQKEGVDAIVVYKKDYVTYFFYQSSGGESFYTKARDLLSSNEDMFPRVYEDNDIIVFTVAK